MKIKKRKGNTHKSIDDAVITNVDTAQDTDKSFENLDELSINNGVDEKIQKRKYFPASERPKRVSCEASKHYNVILDCSEADSPICEKSCYCYKNNLYKNRVRNIRTKEELLYIYSLLLPSRP